jgi:hypothetical protein
LAAVLAAVAALVAAELGLVEEAADLGLAAVEWAEEALELAVAVLGQEAGQELELVEGQKHPESGLLPRHCFEAAVLAVVEPRLAESVPGRAPVALGLA